MSCIVLLIASLAGTTCRRAPHIEKDPAPHAPSAHASASASLDASVHGRCARAKADAEKALAAVDEKHPPSPGESKPATSIGFCADSQRGAWRIVVPSLDGLTDRAQVVFALEARIAAEFEPTEGPVARYESKEKIVDYGIRKPRPPVVFDFDGDGVPELYVQIDAEGNEGYRDREQAFLRFDGKGIAPYAPASGIAFDGMRDVDGDGRPDLLVWAGYVEPLEACGSGFSYDDPPPRFVAHSLANGTFSFDDGPAKAHAKTWCPAPPSIIASSQDAICARLFAKTATDVAAARKKIEASCVDWSCAAEIAGKPQPKGAAEDCARRKKWGARPPPFTL